MNESSIFSKTGKGMHEASGKSSFLSRADRAVLSQVDGKSTLVELNKKFEKIDAAKFQQLMQQFEKDGFVREITPASAPAPSMPKPAATKPSTPKPASSPPSSGDPDEDLDFTAALAKKPAAPKVPIDLAAQARAASAQAASEKAPDFKAREEAQAKAAALAAQRERLEAEVRAKALAAAQAKAKAEAESKATAEAEAAAKAKAQAEAKLKAEAVAKAKAEADAKAVDEAKGKQEAEAKARIEAEAKAKVDAERAKKEAEEKAQREAEESARMEAELKAEAERKAKEEADRLRREAEEKARTEAEEKARREEEERQRIEAERKAKEEAERKAKEEADRLQREAEEKARKEAEEKARRDEEERQRIEAERKAKEEADRLRREAEEKARKEAEEKARIEAERKAKEEAERIAREAEEKTRKEAEEKARIEAERKAKEEAERIAREAEEKVRKEAEEKARIEAERKAKEESERITREAEEKVRKEAEEKARTEAEEKARKDAEVAAAAAAAAASAAAVAAAASAPVAPTAPLAPAQPSKPADALTDSLLADLDSFSVREDEEREKKEAEEKARKEAEDKARREAEAKAMREAEEKKEREEAEARQKQAAQAQATREAEERATREEEERKQRAKESREKLLAGIQPAKAATPSKSGDEFDDIDISDADLGMDDVKADAKKLGKESGKANQDRDKRVRADIDSAARMAARTAEPPASIPSAAEPPARQRRPVRWGKPAAITLLVLVLGGFGLLHVMPVSTAPYEKAASVAIGRPVKIGSARLSVITGVQVKFEGVSIGEGVRIATVHAHPQGGSMFGEKKAFTQIKMEGLSAPQSEIGALLFGTLKGDGLVVSRISATKAKLTGALTLPDLDIDITMSPGGAVQVVTLKSAENKLAARIQPQGESASVEISAGSMQLPFAPAINLSDFALKGTANAKELVASAWDGKLYDGIFTGNARIRWNPEWNVEGDVQVKQFNASVLAPAILSEGRADARGTFSMSGPALEKLGTAARMDGTFIVGKGVLGSFSLSRALQPTSAQSGGRTEFSELTGVGVYNKGAVQVRNLRLSAGLLTANGTADVESSGALSGRVNAELGQQRGSFALSGTTKEPVLKK